MERQIAALQAARQSYQPRVPAVLQSSGVRVELGEPTAPRHDRQELRKKFPRTMGARLATIVAGESNLATRALKVGVVLSGGPAPGGHNVIAGLFDALQAAHPRSQLYGFLNGPIGVIERRLKRLDAATIDAYRNTGGFDLIGTGRDKIATDDQLKACRDNLRGFDALVIIGGDDSNTNAAVLAEYLLAEGSSTVVVGVPKTIDGDLRNEYVETSFGFDSTAKTYAGLVGNVCRDAVSGRSKWHFIRVMGRSASHLALECALQTHPNLCPISEEVERRGQTLPQLVEAIAELVVQRAERGRRYGVVVLPEGVVEAMPDFKRLIDELLQVLGDRSEELEELHTHDERLQLILQAISPESGVLYCSLPPSDQAVLLQRDKHGNIKVSQLEMERLLIYRLEQHFHALDPKGKLYGFTPQPHFFGYEGRCVAPSNFDADYGYALGLTAAALARAGLTGYMAFLQGLCGSPAEWSPGGCPITMLLNLERRLSKDQQVKLVPVIKKALVDLNGAPLRAWRKIRGRCRLADDYVFAGPIGYDGPPAICDARTLTLQLERGGAPGSA